MKHNICFEINRGKEAAGKLRSSQGTIENGEKEKGLASLTKGQQITGVVVSAGEQVTLNFSGQEITVEKDLMKGAMQNDVRLFEVMKVTSSFIELQLLDFPTEKKQPSAPSVKVDKDQDTFLNQKEQTSKQEKKEKEIQDTESKMGDIASKLTEQDYRTLLEEGFTVEDFTFSGLASALNRIKEKGTGFSQNHAGKRKLAYSEEDISARLTAGNLPATKETVQKVTTALALSDTAAKINGRTEKYLISQGLEPTIENIYKAYYSGNARKQEGFQTLSPEAWSELQPQVNEVIEGAGYEVNAENLEDAKWLIENNLPLTKQNFIYKKELDSIKEDTSRDTSKDVVLEKILVGMENGVAPKDVSLRKEPGISGEQIVSDIKSIQEETIVHAVEDNTELTIKKLIDRQMAEDTYQKIEEEAAVSIEAIKAQRQMEEIRLKMTMEVATKLEMKGFHIETEQLEKVVDALRKIEDSYYKGLLKEADADTLDTSIQILKETTQSIEKLKYIPSSVLGITLAERKQQTIPGLLLEGDKLQTAMAKAGEAYETLMTVPNKEYGDSIQKAFKNTESMLKEMNLENTQLNQRAVRILGYNGMEISKESIDQVKAYDLEVTALINNLHPAVTVRLIKEGINPLDMPISELNQTVDRIKEEQGISTEDKFSTYLRKLEKEDGISAEERKAYIGIYRLLHNVENTDGAALGAVIKADREVTLNQLLTAVRTLRKGSVDTVVDDEFGGLESISFDKESITEQLNSVYQGRTGRSGNIGSNIGAEYNNSTMQNGSTEPNGSSENMADAIKEQTKFLQRILKQITEEITPDKLKEVQKAIAQTELQAGQPLAEFAPELASSKGTWETMKTVPVEKLFDQLKNAAGNQKTEDEVYSGKVQEIREICKNSDQAVRFLNEFKMPTTPFNTMMVNHILSNGDSEIKKLLKLRDETAVENSEKSLKNINELSDTLIDKNSMTEAYEKLEQEAKDALNQACTVEIIDSKRLAELKGIGSQITFLRTLAQKEFYRIPIETESGIINMNLTILRGSETSGKVSVTLHSQQLGNVKAELSLKDQSLKGFISCDNRSGLEELQKNVQIIEQTAGEDQITIRQLDFGLSMNGNEIPSYQNQESEEKGASMKSDTERKLYRIAKAMVLTVSATENGISAGKQIDS